MVQKKSKFYYFHTCAGELFTTQPGEIIQMHGHKTLM